MGGAPGDSRPIFTTRRSSWYKMSLSHGSGHGRALGESLPVVMGSPRFDMKMRAKGKISWEVLSRVGENKDLRVGTWVPLRMRNLRRRYRGNSGVQEERDLSQLKLKGWERMERSPVPTHIPRHTCPHSYNVVPGIHAQKHRDASHRPEFIFTSAPYPLCILG